MQVEINRNSILKVDKTSKLYSYDWKYHYKEKG
jgi:hypothetical protein